MMVYIISLMVKASRSKRGTKASQQPDSEDTFELVPNAAGMNQHFVRWLEKAKLHGLEQREIIWEMRLRQGKTELEVAAMLNISRQRVNQLYNEMKREVISRAPRTAEDFAGMREELAEEIRAVVADARQYPDDYRYLAIRLKASEQLAALYGLQLKQENDKLKDGGADAPEAIAADVAKLLADVHGRAKDIQEAKAGIERDVTP